MSANQIIIPIALGIAVLLAVWIAWGIFRTRKPPANPQHRPHTGQVSNDPKAMARSFAEGQTKGGSVEE